MSELGRLIRRRRLELRLTQRAAAKRAGVSLATWQNLERADPPSDGFQDLTIARAAYGLRLPLALLFDTAGRPLPDAGSLPPDLGGPPDDPSTPAEVEQLVDELGRLLRQLAGRSLESFHVVYGQASEAAEHLLELHDGASEDE